MWYSNQWRRQEHWLPHMRTEDTLPKSKVGSVVYSHISFKSLYFLLSAHKPYKCLSNTGCPVLARCNFWTRSQVLSNRNVTKASLQEFEFNLQKLVFTTKDSIYHVLHAILGSFISQKHFNYRRCGKNYK